MMYKINENFKVIGKGTSLVANQEKGEFILHKSLEVATLHEVRVANNIEIEKPKGKMTSEWLTTQIENHLNKQEDIPTMNEQTKPAKKEIDQKYIDIVKNGFENNKDADSIQVELVGAGLKFKQASSVFKKVSEDLGFKMSAKKRSEAVSELLGDFAPKNYEEVEKAVEHITKNIGDTTEAQAVAILRKICKDAEVEFPKRTKAAGASGPRGFKAKAYAWILENKEATKEQLAAFLAENEQREVYVPHYWDIMQLCRKFAS